MATKNIVPRADGEGNIGRVDKKWIKGYFGQIHTESLVNNAGTTVDIDDITGAIPSGASIHSPYLVGSKMVIETAIASGHIMYYNGTNLAYKDETGGTLVADLDDLTDVVIGTPSSGQVLRHNASIWTNSQLAHSDLSSIGTNTHAQIDSHLSSTTNPHATTYIQVGALASAARAAANGVASLDSNSKIPASQLPDTLVSGLHYKGLLDASSGSYPSNPTAGDYYIISVAGTISAVSYYVSDWAAYNGTSWDKIDNQTISATASLGVQKVGNDFRANLASGEGLKLTTNSLGVSYDDTTIGVSAGNLEVKASSLDNSHLSATASIADSKLQTISTTNKVTWAAVNKAGSKLDDIADIAAASQASGQVLIWSNTTSEWIPKNLNWNDINTSASKLDDLGDVVITGATSGQVIVWDAVTSTWVNDYESGGTSYLELDSLTDVIISGATQSQVLRFNGTNWVNTELVYSDLSDSGTTTPSEWDSHISNVNNPHSTTAAQVQAVSIFGDQTVMGLKSFTAFPRVSGTPQNNNDLVNLSYVAAIAQGLIPKEACVAATATNITLIAPQTIDDVSVLAGDRVLVKDQTVGTQNGIYLCAASTWSRALDYNTSSEVQEGTFTFVSGGTANGGGQFVQMTIDPILGTNDLLFAQIGKISAYTGSNGIKLVGADFQVDTSDTNPALEVADNGLRVIADGTTIERTASGLALASGSVTNDYINALASISDSKLRTISSTNKVTWGAVNKTGSLLNDLGDVSVGAQTDGQVLTWEADSSSWIPANVSAAGGGSGADTMVVPLTFLAFTDSGGGGSTWAGINATLSEMFNIEYRNRIKMDLTNTLRYRILSNIVRNGYSGGYIKLRYSVDDGATWADLDTTPLTASLAARGYVTTEWADIVNEARGDVLLSFFGLNTGTNGSASPVLGGLRIELEMTNLQIDGGGSTVYSLPDLTDVDPELDYTNGFVFQANGSQYIGGQLSHGDLSGIGTNNHNQIDSHIADTDNPHVVTASQSGAIPLTYLDTDTTLAADSDTKVPSQHAIKTFVVDFASEGKTWLDPVLDKDLSTDTGLTPTTGDRYIVKATGADGWAGHSNDIAEYDTDHWNFVDAVQGDTVIVLDENVSYTFNGTSWAKSSPTSTYTASNGVKLSTNDFQTDLADTNPALEIADGGLRAKVVTNGGLERASGGLQIQAAKVTNAMLAGGIDLTAKVTGALPEANGGTGESNYTKGDVLWASATNTLSRLPIGANGQSLQVGANQTINWATSSGGSGTGASTIYQSIYWAEMSSTQLNGAIYTKMPAALSTFCGATKSYRKFDASAASQYRIVVVQSAAGYATSTMKLQYTTTNPQFGTWINADAAGTTLGIGTGTGLKETALVDLVAGAKGYVYFRLVTQGGDGVVTPAWTEVRVDFKTAVGGGISSVTAEAPLMGAGTASSHLTIAQSNASTSGYLLASDWSLFNAKSDPAHNHFLNQLSDVSVTNATDNSLLIWAPNLSLWTINTIREVENFGTSDMQVLFNNGGELQGDAGIHYDISEHLLDVTNFEADTAVISLLSASVATFGTIATTSISLVTNLNADTVDGIHASALSSSGHIHATANASVSGFLLASDWQMFNSSSGISNLVEDTTPQLGGNLDLNGYGLSAVSNIPKLEHHLRFNLIDPKTAYGKDHEFSIVPKINRTIVVTNLEVTCDADPTTEPTGDLKHANAFIGLASAAVINDFDTTSGVRSDSSITAATVASGQCIYISLDAEPDAALTQINFDVTYY